MELRGTLRSWNDEKGFGFIRPEQGGADVFVHISAMRGESRPAVGQIVFYVASKDGQGRLRAKQMRGEALGLDRPSIRRKRGSTVANAKPNREKPTRVRRNSDVGIQALPQKVLVLMGLCALPGSSVIALLLSHGVMWPLLVYVLLSTVSFFQYWSDKNSAQKGNWRTPESTLHLTGLLGGWPGALVAQQVFRHKTRKVDFQITFWAIVLLHQGFWLDWQLSGRVLGPMLKGWLPY